jgi:hypothetical protein
MRGTGIKIKNCYLVVQLVQHVDRRSMFHTSVSSEAYVSISFNFPRLDIAFATVNVLVLGSSASLVTAIQLILYHRYFCSLPAHLFYLKSHFVPRRRHSVSVI